MLAEVFREIDSDAREKRNLPIEGETFGSRNYSREHILARKVYGRGNLCGTKKVRSQKTPHLDSLCI